MKLFELNRDFLRKTVVLTLPVILQSLITIGINFMDNLMVGSFGETQIAAASFGNQFSGSFSSSAWASAAARSSCPRSSGAAGSWSRCASPRRSRCA